MHIMDQKEMQVTASSCANHKTQIFIGNSFNKKKTKEEFYG